MDSIQQPPEASLDILDSHHAQTFRQALMNILMTEHAEFTYAQILDGLPTEDALLESWRGMRTHPVFELKHATLCQGSLEKARDFRSRFDPLHLSFGVNVSKPSRIYHHSKSVTFLTYFSIPNTSYAYSERRFHAYRY